MLATLNSELVEDDKHGNAAKDVEAELVACLDESANETSDDHYFVQEDDIEDGWPWQCSSEHQVQEQKWCSDEPVSSLVILQMRHYAMDYRYSPIHISGIEDRSVDASNNRIRALELDIDRSPSKVAAHREVCDTCRQVQSGGEVEEDSMCSWLSGCCYHDTDSGGTPDDRHVTW